MKNDYFDITKIYEKYKGLWVAFDEKLIKVVGSGQSASEAHKQAIEKGHKVPSLFKVPKNNMAYIGQFRCI